VSGGPAASPERPVAASKQDCGGDPLGALQLDAAVYCSPGRPGREQGVVADGRGQNAFYHVLFRVVVRPRPPARLRGGRTQGKELYALVSDGLEEGEEREETWGQEVQNPTPSQLSLGRGG